MFEEPTTASHFIDQANDALLGVTETSDPVTAAKLLELAGIYASLATARAVQELHAELAEIADDFNRLGNR